jgi:carbonic anhydrase
VRRIRIPVVIGAVALALAVHAADQVGGLTARQALDRLMAGNGRFASGAAMHPNQSVDRRAEVAKGQHPVAIILTCSDSRVPPEIAFDQGLGDLFVVRVAGNVVDDHVVGSVEYAVDHLGARLIMVLGHSHCGAVEAAVKGGHAPAHIASLVKSIAPAVEQSRSRPGDFLTNSIDANVLRVVGTLRRCQPILAPLAAQGKISVIGARYDLESGKVVLIP